MPKKSMSDIIEEYLKEILSQKDSIVIQRNEIANTFNCVPSQINYVINTRFTIKQGYIVESKRGGGGYIRIQEMNYVDDQQKLQTLFDTIGSSISERDAIGYIKHLAHQQIIQDSQAVLLEAAMDNLIFEGLNPHVRDQVRANLLKKLLLTAKQNQAL